jgi:hypothetical protein
MPNGEWRMAKQTGLNRNPEAVFDIFRLSDFST